jgi:CRISPR-associated endonuclease/helicase Cas3
LEKGSPADVISTQLVEAGVDIDFPLYIEALAGLDSIIHPRAAAIVKTG